MMKRRRLDVEDWNGNGNVERMILAGPSRLTYTSDTMVMQDEDGKAEAEMCEACRRRFGVDRVDGEKITHGSTIITIPPSHPSTAQSRRKPPRRPGTIPHPPLLAYTIPFILPFVTPAYAAPPPSRPNPTPPPTPTLKVPKRRDIQYLTSAIYPTDLPTTIARVDETELPYILTRSSDGSWQKAEEGWQLYGREAGGHNVLYADPADPSVSQATFAVQSVLPKGWGQESSRTSFYRVPLIVIASVIIALGLVAGIVVMVLNRRKAHRRAKRRAERARRKALLAAGLNVDDIDGNTAEVAFKEKLGELEKQHRTKRKEAGSFVRTKVKRWNAGLRRRKGKGERGKEGEGSMEVLQEDGEEDAEGEVVGGVIPDGLRRRSTDSNRSRSSPRSSFQDSSGSTSVIPSPVVDAREEDGMQPTLGQPVNPVPYFPPAYRPASVRSYHVNDAGPSRPTLTTTVSEPDVVLPISETDKTRAPGYYPAPATEGAEAALAVVSRSDGKSRMTQVDNEEDVGDKGVAHIATDDKRVLERMRMGASAPPVLGEEGAEGPSAPGVEVDEQGFERVEEEVEMPIREEREVHPDIPAPPRSIAQKSYKAAEQMDEREILPSAPPVLRGISPSTPPTSQLTDIPSAPPILEEESDEHEEGHPIPSAPNLEEEDEETDLDTREVGREEGIQGEEEEREEGNSHAEIPIVTPVRYLPRYEP